MDRQYVYDIALYAFFEVFLFVTIPCYSWEILARTPWALLSARIKKLASGIVAAPKQFLVFCWNVMLFGLRASRQRIANRFFDNRANAHSSSEDAISENESPPVWRLRWWVTWVPGAVWLFSLVFALLRLWETVSDPWTFPPVAFAPGWNENTTEVSPDVGGIGIRVGLYIPIALALITLALGLGHNEDSGAKEIGSAQLLTLFYLNFNAVKASAASFKDLTFPDTVIACMTIDLTAAGLHMTNSGKETLASRWFIAVSAINQAIAMVVIGLMLSRIRHNFPWIPCSDIVWWGRINSCSGASGQTWTYFAIRCFVLAHGLWLDVRHSVEFHRLEKDWAELAPGDRIVDKEKEGFEKDDYHYARLRATVFSKWMEWLPSIIVACCSLETLSARISSDNRIEGARLSEWRQSATLVLAIAGALHWLYVMSGVLQELMERDFRLKRSVNFPRYSSSWPPSIPGLDARLLRAAKTGHLKEVRRALRHEADPDARDIPGHADRTALLYAVDRDDLYMVYELLSDKHNASQEVPGTPKAMTLAATRKSLAVLKYLITRMILPSRSCGRIHPSTYRTTYCGQSLKVKLVSCISRNFRAGRYGRLEERSARIRPYILVTVAIEVADSYARDGILRPATTCPTTEHSVLSIDLYSRSQRGPDQFTRCRTYDLPRTQSLLDAFVMAFFDATAPLELVDSESQTLLFRVLQNQRHDSAGRLLDSGANLFHRDRAGQTALSLAIRGKVFEMTVIMLSRELDGDRLLSELWRLPDKAFIWLLENDLISFIMSSTGREMPGSTAHRDFIETAYGKMMFAALRDRRLRMMVALLLDRGWPQDFLFWIVNEEEEEDLAKQLRTMLEMLPLPLREACEAKIKSTGGSWFLHKGLSRGLGPEPDYGVPAHELERAAALGLIFE